MLNKNVVVWHEKKIFINKNNFYLRKRRALSLSFTNYWNDSDKLKKNGKNLVWFFS